MELHRLARSFLWAGLPGLLVACQPTAANPLEQDFQLYAEDPAIPIGEAGSWDLGLMDPGAVVYHDGSFVHFSSQRLTHRALRRVATTFLWFEV